MKNLLLTFTLLLFAQVLFSQTIECNTRILKDDDGMLMESIDYTIILEGNDITFKSYTHPTFSMELTEVKTEIDGGYTTKFYIAEDDSDVLITFDNESNPVTIGIFPVAGADAVYSWLGDKPAEKTYQL